MIIIYWRNWKKVKLVDPGFHLNHNIIIIIFAHQGQTRRFPEVHHPLLLLWCIHQAERYVQTYKLVRLMGHLCGKFEGSTGHADRAIVLWCERENTFIQESHTQRWTFNRIAVMHFDLFSFVAHIIISLLCYCKINVKVSLSPTFIQKLLGLH